MNFTKMQGLGNDYVYVSLFDEKVDNAPALSRAISDRNTGVGSDGLILIGPTSVGVEADVRMEMYNADGSRSEMCGNGIRCVAKYAVDRGLATGPSLTIETDAGPRNVICHGAVGEIQSITVDMGPPILTPAAIPTTLPGDRIVDHPLTVESISWKICCVSMGNPHAVMFVDDVGVVDLARVGPRFERAEVFPERINAHFVEIVEPAMVVMRTWERGSGETKACGTGACAVCVAGALTGKTDRRLTVRLPGGTLDIDWQLDDHVLMTGPANEVFTGIWRP